MRAAVAPKALPERVRLALDLGLRCGWALWCGGRTYSGTWNLIEQPTDQGGHRFLYLRRHLENLAFELDTMGWNIEEVHVERVLHHVSIEQSQQYGGYLAIALAFACEHGARTYGWPPTTIKRMAAGSGRAEKADMIERARELGFNPKDDNEADALCLLRLARHGRPPERAKRKGRKKKA